MDEPIPDWRQQRGLYSPTFLRLFDADEAVGGAAASPPLDFGDPPAAGRRRRLSTPAAPVQDDDVDVTFPSFRFETNSFFCPFSSCFGIIGVFGKVVAFLSKISLNIWKVRRFAGARAAAAARRIDAGGGRVERQADSPYSHRGKTR